MTIPYINNEHCKDFAQLKNYFKNSLTNSNIYDELLEDGRDGVIAKFLQELGEQQLANMIEKIDQNLCDHDYMNHLTTIITGNVQTIKKPHYSKFFAIEKASYKRQKEETTVSLQIKILEHVNENYTIRIETTFGYDQFTINTNKIDIDNITKHISFSNCNRDFSGNIKIDDEKVISKISNINQNRTNENNKPISEEATSNKEIPIVKPTPNTQHHTNKNLQSENGFVDLGLSVLWASCNVGAVSPEMDGSYYTRDELPSLSNVGQLPTEDNFKELVNSCTFKLEYFNGVKVCKVIGPSGNKIYLPLRGYLEYEGSRDVKDFQKGYYWSRTPGNFGGQICWVTDFRMPEFLKYLCQVRIVRKKKDLS